MNIKNFFYIYISSYSFTTACTNKIKETNVIDTNEKPREETKIIDSNGAEKAKLNLDFGAGKLNVSGNEEKFMKGKFIYSKRSGNLK